MTNDKNWLELIFFGVATLFTLLGGVATVAARNPIRGAMGLLSTIVGIAGMYLMLSAEFLAAIQIMVYAGAVVVLFLFVIMLLGASATGSPDTKGWSSRYLGAGVFLIGSFFALWMLQASSSGTTMLPRANPVLGTIEGIGRELFTIGLVPFEISSALLLVAVVGAVAVARGKQPDPTMLPAPGHEKKAAKPAEAPALATKETAS